MLKDDEDVFLDDVSLEKVKNKIGKIITVESNGIDFIDKIIENY